MMNRLLYNIAGSLPCRIISDNGQPYLERYYLGTLLGVRFYLHRFVGSDPDRGLHDHPWPWAGSIVLKGWYWEQTRTGLRRVRWLNWMTGDSFHRVILPRDHRKILELCKTGDPEAFNCAPSPCWTIFFHRAAYTKPWGFLRPIEGENPMVWWPFNHPEDGTGKPGEWWKEVPRGRDEVRRAPL